MTTRRRQPLLAAMAVLLPVLLIAGIWLGGHPEDLPGFARKTFVADDDTRVVDEALRRMAREYYRPLSEARLADASIAGAVASLGDRFSHYLSPAEYHRFGEPASFSGIGVVVAPDPRGLRITHVFDSSPASRGGLRVGEVIAAVDGRSLAGLSEEVGASLVKGRPDTNVTLRLRRAGGGERTVTLTRATISEPVVASLTRTVRGVRLGVV